MILSVKYRAIYFSKSTKQFGVEDYIAILETAVRAKYESGHKLLGKIISETSDLEEKQSACDYASKFHEMWMDRAGDRITKSTA